MTEFHFLRPWWLWALLPVILLGFRILRRGSAVSIWSKVCDAHLLAPLLVYHGRVQRVALVVGAIGSLCCMILALAGPTWSKIAVPTYRQVSPHMILLDLSSAMQAKDLSPNRLTRAKFKIHDLLAQPGAGQFGLMVYSSEPFVVSPLTDDAQTIDILLSALSPSILPVDGNHLEQALVEAKTLFTHIGLNFGDILVLTGQVPSAAAVDAAQKLSKEGYTVSVMPILADKAARSLFAPLAKAGHGDILVLTDSDTDVKRWLAWQQRVAHRRYQMNQQDDMPLWRDQGRWFLVPGLILLLPLFRRGWFERMGK